MPFNSNTARVAGQKSKRGKAKYTAEIREKLNNLTDYLIQDLNTVSYTHLTLPTICSV